MLKNYPLNNSDYDFLSNEFNKLLDEHNKKIKTYKLFLLYLSFKENHDYYIKRKAFIEWKKNNKIFNNLPNKHIKSYDEHCISCSCEQDNLLTGIVNCFSCNCNEIKKKIKNIIIRHQFLKELNPLRYYLYIWNKNVLNKKE